MAELGVGRPGGALGQMPGSLGRAEESNRIQDIKGRIHRRLLERLNLSNLDSVDRNEAIETIRQVVQELLSWESVALNLEEREVLVQQILDEIFGLGPWSL